jgi:hypothetical protein
MSVPKNIDKSVNSARSADTAAMISFELREVIF